MNKETASRLLEENLLTIYGWSFSRLCDKSEAEDLTQDIIYHVLKSIDRLENDDAFYGFLWKIAKNIFRARLRRRKIYFAELSQDCGGMYCMTPEEECINEEEVQTLRRELSLLVRRYREVTVRYYIHGRSCPEIAKELDISVEMVKYYLFKTRKILKEGINMNRRFGEMSYNPRVFRIDFWGCGEYSAYLELFKRKLPGNILLAANDKPLSLTELSVELGVAAVYLEDEVDILESYHVLKRVGDKYQTNIVIFTREYEQCVTEACKAVCEEFAELFCRLLEERLPEMKRYQPFKNELDDNGYKWVFSNLAVYFSVLRFDKETRKRLGEYPLLSNGSYGFIFGYDHDYEHSRFNGIYKYRSDTQKASWISVINYRLFEACQCWRPHNFKTMEAMIAAVNGQRADEENDELIRMIEEGFIHADRGRLSPNFPVFTALELEEIQVLLEPLIQRACEYLLTVCNTAARILNSRVSKLFKDQCEQMACIHFQYDAMASMMEVMTDRGQLIIPSEKANYCMFGVKSEAIGKEGFSC